MIDQEPTSTRPYLIRALYEWCTDNGFTPYLAVHVDRSVQVPREYVKDGEIVLNISFDATSALQLGNDYIEFKARFGGQPREIMVPVNRVIAIYARENGQGMTFVPSMDMPEVEFAQDSPDAASAPKADRVVQLTLAGRDGDDGDSDDDSPTPPTGSGRPSLKRVK